MEKWQEADQPNPRDLLTAYTKDMLADLSEPEDYRAILNKGEAFIKNLGLI